METVYNGNVSRIYSDLSKLASLSATVTLRNGSTLDVGGTDGFTRDLQRIVYLSDALGKSVTYQMGYGREVKFTEYGLDGSTAAQRTGRNTFGQLIICMRDITSIDYH